MTKRQARIIAFGSYLPSKVLTNQDLERLVETSDEWITSRTGIKERRIAAENEFPSDMGTMAAERALHSISLHPDKVEMIIVTTMTPDYISPSTASLIQARIKADHAAAVDVQAACSGFLYGLSIAKAYIESGMYRNVLVVSTEKMSAFMDYTDRTTCIIFGDGAACTVVSDEGPGYLIDSLTLGSNGSLADLVMIPAGGSKIPASEKSVVEKQHYCHMKGNDTFKHAVRMMTQAIQENLHLTGLSTDEINWLIPHQANKRIIDAVAKNLSIPEDKICLILQKYGNTSAASIPIAFSELHERNLIKPHEHILLTAFGGGATWGASILTRYENDK